jgi:hypothetical protein
MKIIQLVALSLVVCLLLVRPHGLSAQDTPEKAALTTKGPVGLYFMVRYLSFSRTLEKAAWYFSSAGDAYENLQTGFSREDLAAHPGRKGKFQSNGQMMSIRWADGTVTQSEIERDTQVKDTFMWDLGAFAPATPFTDSKSAAGIYEGGESISGGGNKAATAQKLELKADGTFTWSGIGLVQGATEKTTLESGATGATSGKWKLSSYSISLTTSDGKILRRIAFPYDDTDTAIKPDYIFFGGLMLKKK